MEHLADRTPPEARDLTLIRQRHCYVRDGWFWHIHDLLYHPDATLMDAHTHGVYLTYGHADFQIVCPMAPHLMRPLFAYLVQQVAQGGQYQRHQLYTVTPSPEDGWRATTIRFCLVPVRTGGRDLLRIVVTEVRSGRHSQQFDFAVQCTVLPEPTV